MAFWGATRLPQYVFFTINIKCQLQGNYSNNLFDLELLTHSTGCPNILSEECQMLKHMFYDDDVLSFFFLKYSLQILLFGCNFTSCECIKLSTFGDSFMIYTGCLKNGAQTLPYVALWKCTL